MKSPGILLFLGLVCTIFVGTFAQTEENAEDSSDKADVEVLPEESAKVDDESENALTKESDSDSEAESDLETANSLGFRVGYGHGGYGGFRPIYGHGIGHGIGHGYGGYGHHGINRVRTYGIGIGIIKHRGIGHTHHYGGHHHIIPPKIVHHHVIPPPKMIHYGHHFHHMPIPPIRPPIYHHHHMPYYG